MAKYHNKKVTFYNIDFHSVREGERYLYLLTLKNNGDIEDLQLQVPFVIHDEFIDCHKKKQRPITYIADFQYIDKKGNMIVEDAKGYPTEGYKLKKKLFMKRYPHILFYEV